MEREDANANAANGDKPVVCILDASTYVGFWILQGMLSKGYNERRDSGEDQGHGGGRRQTGGLQCGSLGLQKHSGSSQGCAAVFCCLDSLDGYSDEKNADLEVRGAINVVEACAQTESIDKIVFSSSLMAAIWKDNISSLEDVDERSWSDPEFCRKLKVPPCLLPLRVRPSFTIEMRFMEASLDLGVGGGIRLLTPAPCLASALAQSSNLNANADVLAVAQCLNCYPGVDTNRHQPTSTPTPPTRWVMPLLPPRLAQGCKPPPIAAHSPGPAADSMSKVVLPTSRRHAAAHEQGHPDSRPD
ncbi:hypothetical protein NL676_034446 [Syzygium grande]|nr:hypothetical protein NL676_034446 [Syzygium grande]